MGQYINLEYFFYKIYQLISWVSGLLFGGSLSNFSSGLTGYSGFFKIFFEFLVVLFLVGIIYCSVRIYEVRKAEKEKYDKAPVAIDDKPYVNQQWEVVLEYLNSDEPSDWRLAVIEADNMLDQMVKKLGYEGQDLGDRLKAVESSDFESLQSAWEAHKVRNQIVHEGSGFQITKFDADRVIKLYENVFREFDFI